MKKPVKTALIAILIIIIAATAIIGAVWHNEIQAAASFHKIKDRNDAHLDGAVYEMSFKGDNYIEDFVEQGGVSSDDELIAFVMNHVTKGVMKIDIETRDIGCAAFTAKSKDGDMLFARNYDMDKANLVIVHTEGSGDRHSTFSTVDLSMLGLDVNKDVTGLVDRLSTLASPYAPLDGMNDAGVSCAVLMSEQGTRHYEPTNQTTDKPDFTTTTFLRLVLDYADDLDEAVEIAQSYDLHDSAETTYHYFIADASGRSAIFEWVNGTNYDDIDGTKRELVVTYNDQDSNIGEAEGNSDYQWITNFIIQPGYYDTEEYMFGLDRYNHIYSRLSETDGIVEDEKAAMEILGEIGRRVWTNDGETITNHSAIYNLTQRTVTWVPNENYSDKDAWFYFEVK